MNNEEVLNRLLEELGTRDRARLDEACAARLPLLLARLRPGMLERLRRFVLRHMGWLIAAVMSAVAAVAVVLLALGVRSRPAPDPERYQMEEKIRVLEDKVNYFDYVNKQMQELLKVGPITLRDPKAFRVVEPGRSRLQLAGDINPAYIQEVRFRWGVDLEEPFTILYKGGAKPDPQGKRVPFEAVSPELGSSGKTIVATVEFIPYPEVKEQYAEFFTPALTQYQRTFLLGKGGISPDKEDVPPAEARLVDILSPTDGARVTAQEAVEGRLKDAQGAWPVAFVKPLVGTEPWWLQGQVEEIENGRFTCDVRFGDLTTRAGTKFRIAIVLVKSKEEALKYRAGDTRLVLPPGLPRSEIVTVVRQ
jgi:hypothetical protein